MGLTDCISLDNLLPDKCYKINDAFLFVISVKAVNGKGLDGPHGP